MPKASMAAAPTDPTMTSTFSATGRVRWFVYVIDF